MKYILFMGQRFYPSGGMGDHIGAYDDIETPKAIVAKCYELESDTWAEIATNDGELRLICHFHSGEWVEDTETPTLESKASDFGYFSSVLDDYLHPENIVEREQLWILHEQERAKKKEIDRLYAALIEANSIGDAGAISELSAKLRELGES